MFTSAINDKAAAVRVKIKVQGGIGTNDATFLDAVVATVPPLPPTFKHLPLLFHIL